MIRLCHQHLHYLWERKMIHSDTAADFFSPICLILNKFFIIPDSFTKNNISANPTPNFTFSFTTFYNFCYNIINYNLNDKSVYTKKNREDIMNETTIKKPDPQFAQDILKQKVNHKKEPRFILL